MQFIENEFAARVYEIHGRIALMNGDISEYNQCQTVLLLLYKQGIKGLAFFIFIVFFQFFVSFVCLFILMIYFGTKWNPFICFFFSFLSSLFILLFFIHLFSISYFFLFYFILFCYLS